MGLFKKRSIKITSKRKEDINDSSDSSDESIVRDHLKKRQKTKSKTLDTKQPIVDIGQVEYDHSHETTVTNTSDATKEDRFYAEERKARELEQQELEKRSGAELNGRYKGQANYTKYIQPRKEGGVKFGPVKPSGANIRSTTMIDYTPDVCKDYKQTGFCGYGDNCKFLHSREDYAAGWKLDKEWDEKQKNKSVKSSEDKQEEGEKSDIPFKCVICKNDYKTPMKTTCQHYFCESCFLTQYRRKPGCFVCGKNTNGIAKPAKDLIKLLQEKQER